MLADKYSLLLVFARHVTFLAGLSARQMTTAERRMAQRIIWNRIFLENVPSLEPQKSGGMYVLVSTNFFFAQSNFFF